MLDTATNSSAALSAAQMEMIEAGGRLCQLIGVPRSVGQIYGLLFMSPYPLSLDDIAERLGISKGSGSTGTRQLLTWNAIRRVWMPGERRDHFVVEPDLGNLIRSTYRDLLKPRLHSSSERIERIADALRNEGADGKLSESELEVCAKRLEMLQRLQKKLQSLIPIAERFL
ncbi:MAG: hypothetical protein O2960_16915 [Verrucomicrobia bacterium]|nr:hypothetical protein [Verrucomicrobiota bacterium]